MDYYGNDLETVRKLHNDGVMIDLKTHCIKQYTDIVDYLLEQGYTPTLECVSEVCRNGCIYLMDKFLQYDIDVNGGDYSSTPLESACRYGHLGIVDRLIAYGADINGTKSGHTPLHHAYRNGYTDIINRLLDMKADSTKLDHHGKPAMYYKK